MTQLRICTTTCLGLLTLSQVYGVDVYWDANDTSAGFGDAAAGTWGSSSFWSTDNSGSFSDSPGTAFTTNDETLYINNDN